MKRILFVLLLLACVAGCEVNDNVGTVSTQEGTS